MRQVFGFILGLIASIAAWLFVVSAWQYLTDELSGAEPFVVGGATLIYGLAAAGFGFGAWRLVHPSRNGQQPMAR